MQFCNVAVAVAVAVALDSKFCIKIFVLSWQRKRRKAQNIFMVR